jgi:hypothetical protein
MEVFSGRTAGFPYSLSRWTDIPADKEKWGWFKQQLKQGWMAALEPYKGMPGKWSLKPEDTLGLIFWTKNPTNLIIDSGLLEPYKTKIHVTLTGWSEVEHGAPDLYAGTDLLCLAARYFGSENVTWRFSPIPLVPDVLHRFEEVLKKVSKTGMKQVFVSFLQENDRVRETRDYLTKIHILQEMGVLAFKYKMTVRLCNDDKEVLKLVEASLGLTLGVCAPPEDFGSNLAIDECGCIKAVDPFSITEACIHACEYCYAGDRQLAAKKKSTTSLPIIGGKSP